MPVLYAGQHMYLDFIHDLFAGVTQPEDCLEKAFTPSRRVMSTDFEGFTDQTWFVEYDKYGI